MPQVTLETIGNGAAVELFARALGEVIVNIDDPNTDARTKRKITLTVEFVPDDKRELVVAKIGVVSKLAPVAPVVTSMGIGPIQGVLQMREALPQESLFPPENRSGAPAAVAVQQ